MQDTIQAVRRYVANLFNVPIEEVVLEPHGIRKFLVVVPKMDGNDNPGWMELFALVSAHTKQLCPDGSMRFSGFRFV